MITKNSTTTTTSANTAQETRRLSFAISLKTKLLLLTLLLVTATLGLQATVSIREFSADKTAFVYETILAGARSSALVAKAEIEAAKSKLDLAEAVSEEASSSSGVADPTLSGQKLRWRTEYKYSDSSGRFEEVTTDEAIPVSGDSSEVVKTLVQRASVFGVGLAPHPRRGSGWFIASRTTSNEGMADVKIGEFDAGGLISMLAQRNVFNLYLLTAQGKVAIQAGNPNFTVPVQDIEMMGKGLLEGAPRSSSAKEVDIGATRYLAGVAPVGHGGLYAVAVVPMEVAVRAVRTIELRSLLLLATLLGLTLTLGVIGASGIVYKLRNLSDAVAEVTKGNFAVQLEEGSRDEVGKLTSGFNFMVSEVKRLLVATAENARMENELKTAQTVQSTLFLPPAFENERIAIHGNYEPASECGGDWWYYAVRDGKARFWLGDATGHGVPAALTTSAIRSALSVVENMKVVSMSDAASLLNRAIHDTSKSKIMMTFFMAEIDLQTLQMEYVLASHEPPILMRASVDKMTKKTAEYLQDERGPRFGDKPEAVFKTAKCQLGPGDLIVVYTDGLTDCANPEGEEIGERNFFKMIFDARNSGEGAEGLASTIRQAYTTHRKGAPLKDDVTFVVLGVKS